MTQSKTPNRGGRRPGAGAKKKSPFRVRVCLGEADYKYLLELCHGSGLRPGELAAAQLVEAMARHRALHAEAESLTDQAVDPWGEEPEPAELSDESDEVVAFKVRLGGEVCVMPEIHPDGTRWVVCYVPAGDDASPSFVECETRDEAEAIARQRALATTDAEAGGHCLI